jgi:two-component system OmpR family response regulator
MEQAEVAQPLHALLVEDEDEMASFLEDGLTEVGWRVARAADGPSALEAAARGRFDVLVVDRMLPGMDGLSMVEQLRARAVDTPVIFLTAMGAVADRVAGLRRGGDDYLVKPFALEELSARMTVLARRPAGGERAATVLRLGELALDRLQRRVRRGGEEIELLPLQFKLLEFLLLNAGRTVTRTMLLEQVWGFQFDPQTNIVETHISRLRGKIQRPGEPPLIVTVRGAGYAIAAPGAMDAR